MEFGPACVSLKAGASFYLKKTTKLDAFHESSESKYCFTLGLGGGARVVQLFGLFFYWVCSLFCFTALSIISGSEGPKQDVDSFMTNMTDEPVKNV